MATNSDRNAITDAEDAAEREDRELIARAKVGEAAALEALVRRHQAYIFNIAVRMLYCPQDAEDATQEILIKVVTKLSTFEGRSRFRTWLYRIATNHLLNMKRGRMEPEMMSFAEYGRGLDSSPDLDLPDPREVPVDVKPGRCDDVDEYSGLGTEIYGGHPYYEPRDLAARVREVVESPKFRSTFEI